MEAGVFLLMWGIYLDGKPVTRITEQNLYSFSGCNEAAEVRRLEFENARRNDADQEMAKRYEFKFRCSDIRG